MRAPGLRRRLTRLRHLHALRHHQQNEQNALHQILHIIHVFVIVSAKLRNNNDYCVPLPKFLMCFVKNAELTRFVV